MEQPPPGHHEDAVGTAGDLVVGGGCVGRPQPRHGPRQRGGRAAAGLVRQVFTDTRPGCSGRGLPGE